MTEVAVTGSTSTVAQRPDRSHESLRARIRRAWEAQHPDAYMRHDALDWYEHLMGYLAKLGRVEGDLIERSYPQLCRGLGLPFDGSVKDARRRWHRKIKDGIEQLVALGLVESFEADYKPNREGRCMLIRLPAGVAQSVRTPANSKPRPRGAAPPGRPPRRPSGAVGGDERGRGPASSIGTLGPPCGASNVGGNARAVAVSESRRNQPQNDVRGGARSLPSRAGGSGDTGHNLEQVQRERASLMRGLVIDQLRTTSLKAGADGLRAAALGGTDPVAVAIVAWELLFGGHPQLTAPRRLHLWRSARRADRYACFGAGRDGSGAELLVTLMESRAAAVAAGEIAAPRSLDYFVCRLRAVSRRWRRTTLGRGEVRDTGQRDRARQRGGQW